MMTSLNGDIFRVLAFCAGNSTVPGEFPSQRSVMRNIVMSSLICARTNSWVNNREAGDLRRHRTHYDDSVMKGVGLRHRNSHIHPSHFWGFHAVADKPLIRIAFKFGGRTHCGTPQASPNTCRFLTSWFVGQFVRISKQTAGGIDLKFGGWIHYGIGQAWWPLPGLMNFLQHSAES